LEYFFLPFFCNVGQRALLRYNGIGIHAYIADIKPGCHLCKLCACIYWLAEHLER
jgi:hypothetical protein